MKEPCKICRRCSYVHIQSLMGLWRRHGDQREESEQSRPPAAGEPSSHDGRSVPSGSMFSSFHSVSTLFYFSVDIPYAQFEAGFDQVFDHLVDSDHNSIENLVKQRQVVQRSFGSLRADHARLPSFQLGTEPGPSLAE